MNVIIKPFETPGGNYVYDRETNAILRVNRDEFESFVRISEKQSTEDDLKVLKRFQDKGYCKESKLKTIKHPEDDVLEFYLDNQIEKITLQVTQDCNLRCSYCTYTDNSNYVSRIHSNKFMSYEVMCKSIDFLMQRSNQIKEVNIGFYGGEPLLAFDNIKKIISYIETKYPDKATTYTMTTNGTILDEDIVNYLHQKKIKIMISLDGPKEMHDLNRKFENGSGSFYTIMENLERVKKSNPEFYSKISFITVVAPGTDFKCVDEFFNAEDIFQHNSLMYNVVSEQYNKIDFQYDELFSINNSLQQVKVLLHELGYISSENISNLYRSYMANLFRTYATLDKSVSLSETAHPGGPCLPGVMRTMVDVNGVIYPCERVSEESDSMKIGHIDTGFDLNKARALLNIGNLTTSECTDCWCFTHCSLCAAAADDIQEGLNGNLKLKGCNGVKSSVLSTLKTICLLREHKYEFRADIYG